MINKQRGTSEALLIIALLAVIAVPLYFYIHFYQSRPASRQQITQIIRFARQVPSKDILKDIGPSEQHDLARVFRHQSITLKQASMVTADLQTLIHRRSDKRVLAHFYASHPARRS